MKENNYKKDFEELVDVIKTLRGPKGCPWDKKQTPKNVCTYLLEEIYEVIEAIDEEDSDKLKEELGDVLLLIIFLADYYEKQGKFNLSGVLKTISTKLIRRHPHVFSDKVLKTPDEVIENWDRLKQQERSGKKNKSFFDSIPKSAPALLRSYLFLRKARRFNKIKPLSREAIIDKIKKDLNHSVDNEEKIADLLFDVIKLFGVMEIDPEACLLNYLENYSKKILKNER